LINALSLAPVPVVAIPTGLEVTSNSGGEVYPLPPFWTNAFSILPLIIMGLTAAPDPLVTVSLGNFSKLSVSEP